MFMGRSTTLMMKLSTGSEPDVNLSLFQATLGRHTHQHLKALGYSQSETCGTEHHIGLGLKIQPGSLNEQEHALTQRSQVSFPAKTQKVADQELFFTIPPEGVDAADTVQELLRHKSRSHQCSGTHRKQSRVE